MDVRPTMRAFSPGWSLLNWRLHSRRWASMSTWRFAIPDNRDGGQCCLSTVRSPADAGRTFIANKSSMRRSWNHCGVAQSSGTKTRTMFGEVPGSTRTRAASSWKACKPSTSINRSIAVLRQNHFYCNLFQVQWYDDWTINILSECVWHITHTLFPHFRVQSMY